MRADIRERMVDFQMASLAASTLRAYEGAAARYRKFMVTHSLTWGKDSFIQFCLSLFDEKGSYSVANHVRSYIQTMGPMEGLPAFADDKEIKQFLQGYKKKWAKKGAAERTPITLDKLEKLIVFTANSTSGTSGRETIAAFWIGYWFLLRSKEVARLQGRDLSIRGDCLSILVRKSNDGQGS